MRKTIPILVLALAAGCGGEAEAPPAGEGGDARAAPGLRLAADPGEAVAVIDARDADGGAGLVVVGRVRKKVDGYAALHLIDESLEYCGQVRAEDNCPTPWDYCCIPQPEQTDATVVVEFVDADGAVVRDDLSGIRLLDLVAIEGTLARDEHDNPVLKATGWYPRGRPELRDGLHWPGE